MNLDNLSLIRMARMQMDWTAQRQKVLAQNVANVDTPGYRARDLRKLDFKRMAQDAVEQAPRPAATHASHVTSGLPHQGPYREVTERRTYETSISGNPVVLEEQMEQISGGRSRYNLAVNLIRKNIGMLRTAMGRGGGQ